MNLKKNIYIIISLLIIFLIILINYFINNKNKTNINEINIITDRSDFVLDNIIEEFEKLYNVKINTTYIDSGIIERIQLRNEWDIFITKNSSELMKLWNEWYLEDISKYIQNIPDENKWKTWYNMSSRIRWFVIHNSLEEYPTSYEDLANPKFKNSICIRPLTHNYNVEMLSYLYIKHWEEFLKNWLEGFKNNLWREPFWNDRSQAMWVWKERVCDIAIMNSYYLWIMAQNDEQKDVLDNVKFYIPWQLEWETWAISLYSAVWIRKWASNNEYVLKFIEYTTEKETQEKISLVNHEFPIIGEDRSDLSKYYINYKWDINNVKKFDVSQKELSSVKEKVLLLIKQYWM